MPATTEASRRQLETARRALHPRCVVCGGSTNALGLEFEVTDDGAVTAELDCSPRFAGYDGMLHGGVISAVLDGAMTNCLFAHGIAAFTAELYVRFRHPVGMGEVATVTARIARRNAPLYVVQAELVQDGRIKATATGKFMKKTEEPAS